MLIDNDLCETDGERAYLAAVAGNDTETTNRLQQLLWLRQYRHSFACAERREALTRFLEEAREDEEERKDDQEEGEGGEGGEKKKDADEEGEESGGGDDEE